MQYHFIVKCKHFFMNTNMYTTHILRLLNFHRINYTTKVEPKTIQINTCGCCRNPYCYVQYSVRAFILEYAM